MNPVRTALAMAAATTSIASCAQVPPPEPVKRPLPAADACHAAKVEAWYGKAATRAVRTEIEKVTGAAKVRWLYPDSVVTMDYSPARLNVMLDRKGDVVRSARCG